MQNLLLVFIVCAGSDAPVDTAVVCPAEFRQALEPWLAHRQGQGHRVAVVSNMQSAADLRGEIRRLAAEGGLRYLLLVGDADPAMFSNFAIRKRSVPAHHEKAVINVHFGSTPEIATDNWYADLDDDRLPDIAVGRLPSDTAGELSLMVQKILNYETSRDFGPWRRQVHFVAGLGGFGTVADAVLEATAKSLIGEGIPSAYTTTMTYGSWQSPYCPDPRLFRQATIDRLNEGSLFWVYLGHGDMQAVDQVAVPGKSYPILTCSDASRLACRHGAPIACLLSCFSGAFDQRHDCLGEDLLRTPGGPVAVLCGSRVTMPYAMSVMGSELLRACFVERPETLGMALLQSKRRMMTNDAPSRQRAALDAAARALSPTASALEMERAEHLDLFNLLGDPLLRIAYPAEVKVSTVPVAKAGSRLAIALDSQVAGPATIELAVRRDRLTFRPPSRQRFEPDALSGYTEVYVRANDPRLASLAIKLPKGRVTTEIAIPPEARGACHVRVFVEGQGTCAAGAADVNVEAPAESR